MRQRISLLAAGIGLAAAAILGSPNDADAKPFSWAFQTDINELDPQARRVVFTRSFIANIMEPLTRYGKDLEVEPALAESWEMVQPDRWKFNLRQGVTFSNGNPFTADDVITTFNRGMSEASPFRGVFAGVKSIEKTGEHTVEISTHGPYPILIRDLTDIMIFDHEWLEEHNALAPVNPTKGEDSYTLRNILGTGPFKLKSYEPDRKIELEENTTWWNQPNKEHNVTEATFRPIKAAPTRVAALLSGEVDMIYPLPLQDIERIEASPDFKVVDGPDITTMYLGMRIGQDKLANGDPNPFQDIRVRKAVYHAIDTKALVERIMRGRATEASVLMSRYHRGYDKRFDGRILPYDPEMAKKLLAEAGFADGFSLTMVAPNDRYVNDQAVALALVSMLAKVGIKVDLQSVPASRWLPMMIKAETDMWLAAWTAVGTIDAHSYLHAIVHSKDGKKGVFNSGQFSSPELDQLEEAIASETDNDKRNELIYKAFSLHRELLPQIPLLQPTLTWATRKNVDVFQSPNSTFDLRWVKID